MNLRQNKFRWILAAVALLIVAAAFAFRPVRPEGPVSYIQEGDTLPETLKLRSLDGKEVTLADFKGKVILINFWAGWCGPCLHEMPSIAALYKKLEKRGLVVLAPSMDEQPEQGVAVLKRVMPEIPFPIFAGLRSEISDRFELDALPHTIIVNRALKVEFSRAGEVNWGGPRAVELIEGLL